jgi:hypothetical protein
MVDKPKLEWHFVQTKRVFVLELIIRDIQTS